MTVYYRHKKRGTIYDIIGGGAAQASKAPIQDCDPVIVYQSIDNDQIYVRPAGEFYDGRFEELTREQVEEIVKEEFNKA